VLFFYIEICTSSIVDKIAIPDQIDYNKERNASINNFGEKVNFIWKIAELL